MRTRRTKILTVRVTDEEFVQLQQVAAARGMDTVSDLVRSMIPEQPVKAANDALARQVAELWGWVRKLDERTSR